MGGHLTGTPARLPGSLAPSDLTNDFKDRLTVFPPW